MSVVKFGKCPNCDYEQTLITTNNKKKKTECNECGETKEFKIV